MWLVLALLSPIALSGQINVLTNRYDAQRTGANLNETTLTPANVSVNQFGKLFSYPVDGAVHAQPLYVSGVVINGSPRNVLYVGTMNDKMYAFDTDSPSLSPLWMTDFTNAPSVTAIPITDIVAPNLNIIGNVGIEGTPVIDQATGALYLIARTKENGNYVQRLHSLDITTGLERAGSPVTITGSVPGTAPDSIDGGTEGRVIPFDPKMQNQRAGLALSNGVVLVAWGSHEDVTPYHGWIMGFDATTLARVGIFATTPDAYMGGVWQGSRAPTIDAAGNAYFSTGNGNWDGIRNFGDSLLKFSVSQTGLALVDYFTPSNEAQLNIGDDDLSGSGFTLLPGTNLLLGGGKEGVLYLLDANNLGHKVSNDTQIVQKIAVNGGHVMGGPVFWSSPGAGPLVYNWAEEDVLKAYRLSGGRLATPPYAQGQVVSPGHPGGSLTVSANGSAAGSGIVWASMPTNQDALHGPAAGILRASNAETLEQIWTSDQNAARDRIGTLIKFVPPLVANGRVYLPNHDNQVAVYGLLPADFIVRTNPGGTVIPPGGSGTVSVIVDAIGPFTGPVDLSASGQPSGMSLSFTPQSLTGPGSATMTVNVSSDTAQGSFSITVSGTSGARVRSANVVVNVNTSSAGLGAIGIDFLGSSPTAMGAAETAGVVAKSNWNNAVGATRSTPLGLVDETGTATGATVTWTANGTWMTPVIDQAGNRRMMKGYLDTTNTSATTVTVAQLSPRAYDVYVYADGDNKSYARAAAYTISGPGITQTTITLTDVANTNFGTTFTQAANSNGNYVKFSINAGGFTLTATPTTPASGTRRAPINAVQIVPGAPANPDFTIAASPDTGTVMAGNSTSYSVTIAALNGFADTVSLGLTGAPAGTTTSFTPGSIGGGQSATLNVTTAATTPSGNSILTLTGTSGSLTHSTTVTLSVGSATPSAISVDFAGTNPTKMGAAETAGVVAKSNWNNAAGATRTTPLALVNEAGAPTTATMTWTAYGTWMTPVTDQAGNRRMMKGYLDTSNTSVTTITVAGLPSAAYDVYVYDDGDNRQYARTAAYQISGAGITPTTINMTDPANTNFDATFVQASSTGNYVKFSISGSGFTLTATPGAAGNLTRRAPVNGIQIVPTVPAGSASR